LREREDFTTEHAEHTEVRQRRGGDWEDKNGGREERREQRGQGGKRGKKWDGLDSDLTHLIIGCAMRVHRELGPGLLESVYELCLLDELRQAGLRVDNQIVCDVLYMGRTVASGLRMDMLVEDRVVIEIKAVEGLKRVHFAQLMTYLKLSNNKLGLLINFNEHMLKAGIKRIIL